jgi:hypothetical protein
MYIRVFGRTVAFVGFLSTFTIAPVAAISDGGKYTGGCYYLPTDPQWPSDAQWNSLNTTVGGKLIRGVPLARPCYGPNVDPARCAVVTENFDAQDIL